MDIHEIRKANLLYLIGKEKKAVCAERWIINPAHLSQILSKKTAKNLGDEVARRIEKAEGLHWGWMDTLQAGAQGKTLALAGFVAIAPLKVMADGQDLPEQPTEAIQTIIVHLNWLKSQGLSFSSLDNLALASADGDSMEGTFRDGDLLLLDRGVSEVKADAIYAFTLDGKLLIRRLQQVAPGALLMIADNKTYSPVTLEGAERERLRIHARVLLVLNARKL